MGGRRLPPDDGPRDLLARILDHDERAESATRAGTPDPHHELATLVQQYEDALPLLAQHVLGTERMRSLDDALERWMPGLTSQPTYPGLRGQIALRWADGDSPNEVLQQATWWQTKEELVREDDPAAALARNVARTSLGRSDEGPSPWLPAVPRLIRSHESAGAYLERLVGRINELASLPEPPGRAPEHDDRLSTGRNHQQRAVPARAPVGRGAARTETLRSHHDAGGGEVRRRHRGPQVPGDGDGALTAVLDVVGLAEEQVGRAAAERGDLLRPGEQQDVTAVRAGGSGTADPVGDATVVPDCDSQWKSSGLIA